MKEQSAADRASSRRHLIFYLRVMDKKTRRLLGYLGDISETGMMLMSNDPIEADRKYEVSIKLNDKINKRDKIDIVAHCMWCHPTVNQDIYDAGFKFEKLDPAILDTIRDVVEEMGFRDD